MKLQDIHFRDPFILANKEDKTYYMYGSNGKTTWGDFEDKFYYYKSSDLEDWEGPFVAFEAPKEFWSNLNYWAPEVHKYNNKYYLFASFKREDKCRGTQIFVSDTPYNFTPITEYPITPKEWECLDGTLFVDKSGDPYMIFCHEWIQVRDGEMCAMKLSKDLKEALSDPILLFNATDATWALNENDTDNSNNGFITDGPFLYRLSNNKLIMIWSSFGKDKKYKVGVAVSKTDDVLGPWEQLKEPLKTEDGGHAMIFKTFDNQLKISFHAPNCSPYERPIFLDITETNTGIEIL